MHEIGFVKLAWNSIKGLKENVDVGIPRKFQLCEKWDQIMNSMVVAKIRDEKHFQRVLCLNL